MSTVLGIDAAWTATNPSGVALATTSAAGWRLAAVAPSFAAFYALAGYEGVPASFDAGPLIAAATRLVGRRPDLVTVDMPLAELPITGRRVSDNVISSLYAARGAATHSPTPQRPGRVALDMLQSLSRAGYPLRCSAPLSTPGTIEVYPHPALIELTGATRRLPYKVQKRSKYWRADPPQVRLANIFEQWTHIVSHLETVLSGAAALLPLPPTDAPLRSLKAFEDSLDAVICTWIGRCALENHATAHGDATSTIWTPTPSPTTQPPPR